MQARQAGIVVSGALAAISAAALAFAQAPAADAHGIKVETGRSLYVAGDVVEITVTNAGKEPVYLQGCGSYHVEVFENERYSSLPSERCVSEGDALLVPPGTLQLKYEATGERQGQILRVALAYGWGCQPERPLSQARCAGFASAWSPSFRIGKRNEKE
jgi:hypothetical protein